MHERDTPKKNLSPGRWPSIISAAAVASGSPRLAEPSMVGDSVYWLQNVPQEKGRTTLMRTTLGETRDKPVSVLPRPLSAKSKVHEYGGGSYTIADNTIYFVLGDDQQIYRATLDSKAPFNPECLTSSGPIAARYGNLLHDHHNESVIAVCEDHSDKLSEPRTTLVNITSEGDINTIASGDDFYSSPVVSPCGKRIVWLCWNHPDMPWDTTELWFAERDARGNFKKANSRKLIDSHKQSIFQPQFHPNGDLYFVSDKDNWWNLYRITATQFDDPSPEIVKVFEANAEFATPQWVFKMSTYGFLDANTLLACCSRNGCWELLQLDITTLPARAQRVNNTPSTLNHFSDVFCNGKGTGVCIAASPASAPQVYTHKSHHPLEPVLPTGVALPKGDIATPRAVSFPTSQNEQAHGFFYAPANSECISQDELPPLIVICHGGPTGATDTAFNPKIQYWTNRGFAIMDVNYRGSTGYGRQYRHSLHNNWGIFDVEDVCAAARYAVSQGWADPDKLIIKGSSAGGFTVLAALAFSNTFKAGVSLYGIGDLETLVRDTHKFEARYLDSLVGNYPEQKDIYKQRSPIHHAKNINCPLLVFQGMQDKVVPPNQARTMVDAVTTNGLYVDYVTFEDEGHGFRDANTIKTMLERELAFYQKVFHL